MLCRSDTTAFRRISLTPGFTGNRMVWFPDIVSGHSPNPREWLRTKGEGSIRANGMASAAVAVKADEEMRRVEEIRAFMSSGHVDYACRYSYGGEDENY